MATMAVFTLLDLTKVFPPSTAMCIWPPWAWWSPLVVAVIALPVRPAKYYGRPGWEREPTASNRKEVKLGSWEKQILESLAHRHCYMSDLTDALGVDSRPPAPPWRTWIRAATWSCRHERLQVLHLYHRREGAGGPAPPLSGKGGREMAGEFLNPLYVQLLKGRG